MNLALRFKSTDGLIGERLVGARDTWTRIAAGRIAPRREEITPALLRNVLPWIWIVDVMDGGADFRFRLAGDRVIQFMGRRYAGSLLSEHLKGAFFHRMKVLFTECARQRSPIAVGPEQTNMPGKEFLEIEVIALPLSEDGETVSGLFGAIDLRALIAPAGGR